MIKHPEKEIIVNEEYNHGQPTIPSGHTVVQIVQLLEEGYNIETAASRLEVDTKEIRAASAYYRRYKKEIDKLKQEKMSVANEYRPEYI